MIDSLPPRWLCTKCGQPIALCEGFLEIMNHRHGEWATYDPDAIEPDEEHPFERDPEERSQAQIDAAVRMVDDPGISFNVYHDACRANEETVGYIITTERAATLDGWLAWAEHVGMKTWMRKRDVLGMLRFWYSGHGREEPPLP